MNFPQQKCPDVANPAQATLDSERHRNHPRCVVCGDANERGFRLDFTVAADGSVSAVSQCEESLAGYTGVVHGGVISSLLDGAMTNCLFAHGIVAVTAELTVRFRQVLQVGAPARIHAWITRGTPHLYFLAAEVAQFERVAASARAKFRRPNNPSLQIRET